MVALIKKILEKGCFLINIMQVVSIMIDESISIS